MRIRQFIFLMLCLFADLAYAQPSGNSSVKVPDILKAFVLKDYDVLDLAKGDLNRDAYPDYIMVLRKPNEKEMSRVGAQSVKRPLLILIGQPNKTYKLAGRNDNVVYCVDCGGMMGDPFEGITIKNGYFSIEHYGGTAWRWTRIITFKYSPSEKKWFLYKDGGESYHTSAPDYAKTSVKTVKDFGKVAFEEYDADKDK